MRYSIGLDFGTSSLKMTILDERAAEVLSETEEYFNKQFPGGGMEQDPEVWYQALVTVLKNAREHGIDTQDIAAICVSGQMRGLTLLDKEHKPIRDSIIWADTRCRKQVEEVTSKHNDLIMRVAHTKLDTGCTLPKILWVKENEPEAWEKTDQFVYPPNYLTFKLTGKINMDRDNASGTCIFDLFQNEWSDEIIELYDLDKSKFPPLIDSRSLIGGVTRDCARETGLKEGTPVIAGGGDSSVEMFSTGITDLHTFKLRLGSGGEIGTLIDPNHLEGKDNFFCFRNLNTDYLIGGIYLRTCAQSVKWVRDMFFSELPQTGETYALMDKEGETVELGADGVTFHPYLLGEGSPYYNMDIRAMFHGFSTNHRRRHAVRACYEGLSLSFRNAMEGDGVFDQCERVVAVGGGTKSRLWIGILADVLGREVIIPKYCDAAYGAALIAGQGIGLWDCDDIHAQNVKQSRLIQPNMENHKAYSKLLKEYQTIAENELARVLEKEKNHD